MTYDDISLGTWMRMEEEGKDLEAIQRNVSDISILSGIDYDELYSMDIKEFAKIQAKYAFLNDRMPTRMVAKFEDKPIILDFAKLSFGDFVDIMEILKQSQTQYDMVIAKIWQSGLPLKEAAKIIRERMPAPVAMGLSAFFLDYWQRLEIRILKSLTRKARRQMLKLQIQAALSRITDGLFGLIRSLRATLYNGNKLK